jgi:hypothetical protein
MADRPTPPKPCPICKIAMQLKSVPNGTIHICQRCGLEIAVIPEPKKP